MVNRNIARDKSRNSKTTTITNSARRLVIDTNEMAFNKRERERENTKRNLVGVLFLYFVFLSSWWV